MSITRCILRWGLIGGLTLGGVTLLLGPDRVAAGLSQVRSKAQSIVDRCVDNPIALRRQLASLADQYPDRIAEVRGELVEVAQEMGQIGRDCEIARRVVMLTTEDLGHLKSLVVRAKAAAEHARPVSIRFGGVRFNIEQAYDEARRINQVRLNYQDRLAQDEQQTTLLNEQAARLNEIREQLESEYATFQSQLWQLDRQIDAIERNDRLIELIEEQQATLESYDKWGKVENLKQLESKLAELRTIQQAQLDTLRNKGIRHDYQERAMYDLEPETFPQTFEDVFEGIETDDEADQTDQTSNSVAWIGPLVID